MSDYSVVGIFNNKTYGVFDNYRDARELYRKLEPNMAMAHHSVDILCMHPCGCLYMAFFEKMRALRGAQFTTRETLEWRHISWRRTVACKSHEPWEEWPMYGLNDDALDAAAAREQRIATRRLLETGKAR